MSPPRAHDSRPISLGSPDAITLLLDRLDRLDDSITSVSERLRLVERTCDRIEEQQAAAKSRISRETEKQDSEDKTIDERVRALETSAAEAKGTNKLLALLALVSAGGAGAGLTEAVKAIT